MGNSSWGNGYHTGKSEGFKKGALITGLVVAVAKGVIEATKKLVRKD